MGLQRKEKLSSRVRVACSHNVQSLREDDPDQYLTCIMPWLVPSTVAATVTKASGSLKGLWH